MTSPPSRPAERRRIVVTDDDPRLLESIVVTLREAGYCVFAAYDGHAGCQLALAIDRLDLLITNTRLSNLTAVELIREVRRVKPALRILHVGEPLPDEPAMSDVPSLREPFTADALLREVSRLLGATGR